MGVVLKGHDRSLDRTIAIKVLAPHLASNGAARQRFSREAKAAAAVLHPNVIAIHSVSNGGELPYLVMPYIRGASLQKRIDTEGPLPLGDILRIGAQIASGLASAHAQGLVHRDIKPANIMLEDGVERVAITDFGLARAVDDSTMTRSGVIAGTPQYMSPEQSRGESIDRPSDLFSLGSVLYTMCTGRPPFRAETSYGVLRRITDNEPRPIREINPDIPDWLCAIIAKLMAKHPQDRCASADEVAELLEECLAHVQQPTTVPLPARIGNLQPEKASQPPSRFRRVALAVAGGLLFIVAAIVITLELNKGTLKIETAEVGIPIRIMKGDDLCKEMIVTARNNTVRITAGQYVVEIVGKHDGLRVESDGVITVTRGETKLVRITQRDRGGGSQQPLGNLPVVGFRLAYFDPAPGLGEYFIPGSDRKVFVELERVAKNDDVASARVIDDPERVPAIEITFNEESAKRLREVTQRHRGKPLAVFVDGRLLSAPTIREGFASQAVITGRFTRAEAERIASGLNARSERERDTKNDKTPLWHEFGVTPAAVSPLTAQVLEWIGLHLQPITKERFREKNVFANYAGGLDVTFVRTGGPAEKAGIHEVDIVVRLLGRPMTSLRDLDSAMREALERIERGDRHYLQFHVLRGGETLQVKVPFPSQSIASEGVQPLQSLQETFPKTADSPDSEQPHELRWDGGITADHAIVRGTQGYTGPNLPGNTPLDRLLVGTYWYLVNFNTVWRIELPAVEENPNLMLPHRPNLTGKNLDVKVTVEAKDDVEFIVIEIHNRAAETIRISEADLQLLLAIQGPSADTRVMSPLWSKIAAGEAIPETKIEPDQTTTLRLKWADWVKYGFWFSRGGEVITEPSFLEVEADKTWVRVTPGRALPVSVTHPDKIVATVDGERIRPAGDRLSIDKSTLPRVSDNLQANLKVRS
ncbi:MAG: protein kinase, partial [Woeseiaceae bacterium]